MVKIFWKKSPFLVVISLPVGCNAWYFSILCSWISFSCQHIWHMLFGYMFLKLFFISSSFCPCFEQSAGLEADHCIHVLWPLSQSPWVYSLWQVFHQWLILPIIFHFLLKECFCPFIYNSLYFCPFSCDDVFCDSHLLCQLLILYSPSLFYVGFCHQVC